MSDYERLGNGSQIDVADGRSNPRKSPSSPRSRRGSDDGSPTADAADIDGQPADSQRVAEYEKSYLNVEVDDAEPLLKNGDAEIHHSSLLVNPKLDSLGSGSYDGKSGSPLGLKRCLRSNCCAALTSFGLVSGLVLFFILHYLLFPGLKDKIRNNIVIKPSNLNWVEPIATTSISCYFYNVTNANDVFAKRRKASVKQIGPYVYTVVVTRTNITWNDHNDTVSYRLTPTFTFDPQRSAGPEEDLVTTVDIPTVALHAVAGSIGGPILNMLFSLDENVFETLTVKQVLWGYHSKNLATLVTKIKKIDFLNLMGPVIEKIPKTVGYFFDKNGTAGDLLNVFTGVKDFEMFNQVHAWNGLDKFPYWASKAANTMCGTDGSLFQPFSDSKSKLTFFSGELYRSFDLEYLKTHSVKGVDCMRFIIPDSSFSNTTMTDDASLDNYDYDDHIDYSSWLRSSLPNKTSSRVDQDDFFDSDDNQSNETDIKRLQSPRGGFCAPKCIPNGMYSLEPVSHGPIFFPAPPGTPLFISLPHLLGADQVYSQEVEGMAPREEKHRPYFDIEDVTGAVVRQSRRYQLNVRLTNNQETLVPLFWVDTVSEVCDQNAADIRLAHLGYHAVYVLRYVVLAAGLLSLALLLIHLAIRGACRNECADDSDLCPRGPPECPHNTPSVQGTEDKEGIERVSIPCHLCRMSHPQTVPALGPFNCAII